jgi:hypothetical protein
MNGRIWTSASMTLLLTAGGLTATNAFGAGTPTVGVGGVAPSTASYTGNVGPGQPDPLGPPAPACQQQSGCQRQVVTLKAPSGWTNKHSITLGVALKYGSGGSDDLDLAIFDAKGNMLSSAYDVGGGQVVAATNVSAGNFTVEVDGDPTVTPQDYTALLSAASGPKYVPAPRTTGGITFSNSTLTDPYRLGTEPNIAISPDGHTVYESPIFGFSTTQSFLTRSSNGGKTFNVLGLPGVGKTDQCTGGGDSDLQTDAFPGDLYMIDLGGAPEVPARVTANRGLTFASSCEANFHDGANYFTDRQWLSYDKKHKVMWYIYRDGVVNTTTLPGVGATDVGKQGYGEFLKYAPLASAAGQAGSAQLAFTNICDNTTGDATPCIHDVQIAGNPVTDNTSSSPHYGTTYLAMTTGAGVGVTAFTTSKTSVHEYTAAKNSSAILFPTVAVDRAGVVYEAWTDATNYRVYLSHTVGTNLSRWTKPVVVNGAPVTTTVMPWVVAGKKGRIDVVFYGSPQLSAPTTNSGPWYPYLAQSLNATRATPTFHQARMTDHPNHIEPVCLSGLGCTTNTGPAGDRELGDFFRVAVDKSGRALVSFADGDNQLGTEVAGGPAAAPSFADFVRQSTGPSLYGRTVSRVATPRNCVTTGKHHDPVPFVVPDTGTQGADVPALNLHASCLTRAANGTIKATITLNTLDLNAAVAPPALPTATYMVRWVYRHKVYFAAAEDSGGQMRYFSGQSAPVSDGAAIKYAYYPASGTATGTVDDQSKTITITVPGNQVGSPPAGARLSTVTGYALTHSSPSAATAPTASNFSDFPQVADVLPSYTAVLGGSHAAFRSVAAGPTIGNGNWKAPLACLLALAGLGCAVLGGRSRSETAAALGV